MKVEKEKEAARKHWKCDKCNTQNFLQVINHSDGFQENLHAGQSGLVVVVKVECVSLPLSMITISA